MTYEEAKEHVKTSLCMLDNNGDRVFGSLSWSFRQACAFGMTEAMRESYRIRFEALADLTKRPEYSYPC